VKLGTAEITIPPRVVYFAALLLVSACGGIAFHESGEESRGVEVRDGELVFQSGFEENTRIVPLGENNHQFLGRDNTLPEKSDWVEGLRNQARITDCSINYTGGNPTQRFAKIIQEPGNPTNRVLWFWLNDYYPGWQGNVNGRVQIDLYGIEEGYREFYQSMRVFLHEDFLVLRNYPQKITWLSISEIWNNKWWISGEKYGFRITLGVGKYTDIENDLHFILSADDAEQRGVWHGDNTSVKVPIGKWFTMEYYFKEGDVRNGRFCMAITPEGEDRVVVFDITNFTHHTKDPSPDGVSGYNPMKLYTSREVIEYMRSHGRTLQIYWDDFKIWKGGRPPIGRRDH
jgi:hypothetical protein